MLKLLIHELIHALDIDIKYETNEDNKKLLELYNINENNLLIKMNHM